MHRIIYIGHRVTYVHMYTQYLVIENYHDIHGPLPSDKSRSKQLAKYDFDPGVSDI